MNEFQIGGVIYVWPFGSLIYCCLGREFSLIKSLTNATVNICLLG